MKLRYVMKKVLKQSGLLGASAIFTTSLVFAGVVNFAQPGGAGAIQVATDGTGSTTSAPKPTATTTPKVDCQEIFSSICYQKPSVNLTAPTAYATVSGKAVKISANASSAAGVAGVQFKIGSTNIGAEDRIAPYSVTLNTTTFKNGGQILSAIARSNNGLKTEVDETIKISNTTTVTLTPVKTTQTTTSSPSTSCTPQDQYPTTNVIYCGLSGSDSTGWASSFKTYYNNNNDGHGHTDIQTVYNAAGFKGTMFTSGSWHYGMSYNDGTIVVGTSVVATNVQIASRCFSGMSNCQPTYRYTHLASNVYTRDATWFFDTGTTSHQTLVHFNADGVADFAMWKGCGNVLVFKPKTQPKQSLACVELAKNTGTETDTTISYVFTATATEQNQTNGKMVIDFGDGTNSKTVNIDKSSVSFTETHVYNKTAIQKTVTAQIMIGTNGLAKSDNANCAKSVVIPPKASRSLACVDLTANVKDQAKTKYTFTATASGNNTTIDYFTFNFGDGSSKNKVTTSNSTATSSVHTFKPGTYTITASVTGPLGTFNGSACQTKITVKTQPPKELTNTGPGSVISIFGLTTIMGTALHQFVLRRKYGN